MLLTTITMIFYYHEYGLQNKTFSTSGREFSSSCCKGDKWAGWQYQWNFASFAYLSLKYRHEAYIYGFPRMLAFSQCFWIVSIIIITLFTGVYVSASMGKLDMSKRYIFWDCVSGRNQFWAFFTALVSFSWLAGIKMTYHTQLNSGQRKKRFFFFRPPPLDFAGYWAEYCTVVDWQINWKWKDSAIPW